MNLLLVVENVECHKSYRGSCGKN